MSGVRKEEPSPRRRANRGWDEATKLVRAALNEPGEWHALDIPDYMNAASVNSTLHYRLIKEMGVEVNQRDGVAYMRIPR